MTSSSRLTSGLARTINHQTRITKSPSNLTVDPNAKRIYDWWLPYQTEYIAWDVPFGVVEKGRRTGLSEAQAFRSNMNCLLNKKNTYYSTYNFPSSRVFIKKCAKWAKAFNALSKHQYGRELIDEKNGISMYKIEYLNGRFIEAIPDSPNSFRDKDSFGTEIVKDEAAFSQHLDEILESVKALNIWDAGSSIRIVSTHFGQENPFNGLVEECKKNPKKGAIMTVSFSSAIAQGLYKKICELSGKEWSPEREREYIEYWKEFYGFAAAQELEAIPRKMGGSALFHSSIFRYVMPDPVVLENSMKIRAWDFASTPEEAQKHQSYYTATTLFAIVEDDPRFDEPYLLLLDAEAEKRSPEDVEAWLKEKDETDDRLTMFVVEEEGGSTGKFFTNHLTKIVQNRNLDSYKPIKSKMVRATPLIAALKHNQMMLDARRKEYFEDHYVGHVIQFDGSPRPLTNDLTDCTSMTWDYYQETFNEWIAS